MLIIVILFAFILVAIFGTKLLHAFSTNVNDNLLLTNSSREYVSTVDSYAPSFFDSLFVFLLVLLWVATIILSFMIDSHPVFFIIGLFLLVILILVGFLMGNVFSDITSNTELSSDMTQFTLSQWVFNNLGLVVLVMSATILIALYVKSQMISGGGGY